MKRAICLPLAIAIACAACVPIAQASLAPGEVETVLLLPNGDSPEGIAVDRASGTIFIGNRRPDGQLLNNEVVTLDAQGQVAPFAILPQTPIDPSGAGESGVLGLAVDLRGAVFAALVSPDANTRGVYRITAGGSQVERLAGSGSILYPNALTFDNQRRLYVTDSLSGSVWRFNPDDVDQAGELWVQHELLAPFPEDPFGRPIGGANGTAFFPNRIYVANTEKGLIASITINPDGTAGTPTLAAGGNPVGQLMTVDGIAADDRGNLHAVIPTYEVAALLVPPILQPPGGYAPLVQVDPNTGEITSTVFDTADAPNFDVPLSLAFGTVGDHRTTVFIPNGALSAAQGVPGPGPRIIQVGTGAAGFFTVPEPSASSLVAGVLLTSTLVPRKRRRRRYVNSVYRGPMEIFLATASSGYRSDS
jgi:hypothetical protein